MHHAPIAPDETAFGIDIVDLGLLHLRQYLVRIIRANCLHGGEVLQCGGVVRSLNARWHALHLLEKLAAPGARIGVLVPVPAVGQVHALSGVEAQGVNIVDEHQQARQLHGLGDAKLIGRLDGVDGVTTRVGQPENLGLAALCLEQE